VVVAWAVVAIFEILMAGRDRRRAVSAQRARDAEAAPEAVAPDAPAVAMVAEPGDAPPPIANADTDVDRAPAVAAAPAPDSPTTDDDSDVAAATAEDEPPAFDEREWPPVSVARGPFEPVVGAPDAGPLPVPPPLAVPPPPGGDPAEDTR
jgi:hypothetical protein